jgi:hypothetical protein
MTHKEFLAVCGRGQDDFPKVLKVLNPLIPIRANISIGLIQTIRMAKEIVRLLLPNRLTIQNQTILLNRPIGLVSREKPKNKRGIAVSVKMNNAPETGKQKENE